MEQAIFAGGCFWCIETIFAELKGVKQVVSGYIGGMVEDPTYEQVCSGETGHAEAVRIDYDPAIISYQDLLEIFFSVHDPTTLNRQGNDIGTQYRSAIFYHNEDQALLAKVVIEREQANRMAQIVTEVVSATKFYLAEDYHHDYFNRNPEQGYCRLVISPKVAKFRKKYQERLKLQE